MAKYLLGSVGSAEAFRVRGGHRELAFVAKTLTSSSINVSIEKEELRAGTGAPVVAQFYHSPQVEITLEDVFFKAEYMESQLGTHFEANADAFVSETLTVNASGAITLAKAPIALGGLVCSDIADSAFIWASIAGADDWKTFEASSTSVTLGDDYAEKTVCVRYLAEEDSARKAIVNSNFVPEELYLIITTPIFAGDACAASKSTIAGSLTFAVPRFKLNGGQEFNFEATSTFNMSLSGVALANSTTCDINNAELFQIIEVITGRTITKLVTSLPGNAGKANDEFEVHAQYSDGALGAIRVDDLTLAASTQLAKDGDFILKVKSDATTGTETITFSGKTVEVTIA